VWKAKFSRFCICHDICIGGHLCRGHHETLTAWLCDVVDNNFIKALHPNMRCAIPIIANSFLNMGGARHLWWNYIISQKQTLLCCLWLVIFRKISRDPLLPIWAPLGKTYSSIVLKKTSSIPCLEGNFLKVLHLPRHLNRQFLMSRPWRYLNSVVMWHNLYRLHLNSPP
jgi:hypothetical protein